MLTRRNVFRAAVLAGGLPFSPARAGTPIVGQQAPGFYRAKLGSLEITVVNDGVSRMPIGDGFVANASVAEVKTALEAAFLEPDLYAGPYNPLLVNDGTRLTLIDTGTGEAAFRASGGLNGRLLLNLAAAGIDPAAIDLVVLTHYHGDHINGLLLADGSLAFPNAAVLAPEPEHRFWMSEDEMARAVRPRVQDGFKNVRRVMNREVLGRLRTYEWESEVTPGIASVGTPGHTPGHSSLLITSGDKRLFVQGDVTHAPFLFARHPEWHFMLDVDGEAAEATRRKCYERFVADRTLVHGFHYPFPALAHVERSGAGYREVLVPWTAVL